VWRNLTHLTVETVRPLALPCANASGGAAYSRGATANIAVDGAGGAYPRGPTLLPSGPVGSVGCLVRVGPVWVGQRSP